MTCMIPRTARTHPDAGVRYPREIAAAVTLPAACAALVTPGTAPLPRTAAIAVTTACAALATRLALVSFLAAADRPEPRSVRPHDPFHEPTPPALLGLGPAPDRDRLRTAGDRCADAWRQWRSADATADTSDGSAGALSVAAWCSWALGSPVRAQIRARYALDVRPDDPLAGLVLRSVRAGSVPGWERR